MRCSASVVNISIPLSRHQLKRSSYIDIVIAEHPTRSVQIFPIKVKYRHTRTWSDGKLGGKVLIVTLVFVNVLSLNLWSLLIEIDFAVLLFGNSKNPVNF